ncbi:uncharacterized protein ZGC:112980 isoform X3 [Latimeria chalumnae]|uniref:uncharacterized protein ZGC:112980 isoform X3 n=1 Tax=Latimeria chalumnae TaxID=7897 RepID=UPI00313BCC6E
MSGCERSVIIISDDEAETTLTHSVLVVEELDDQTNTSGDQCSEVVDEEYGLAITFSKKGKIMPHGRYDCMEHPFLRTESDTCSPLGKNGSFCEQCFCYICDKLASECYYWVVPSLCHCNAHNKSTHWKNYRYVRLTGVLSLFNLDLTEIDEDLKHGGQLLASFETELSVEYNKYLQGEVVQPDTVYPCACLCQTSQKKAFCYVCGVNHAPVVMYRYSQVSDLVTNFLNKADSENPKAAAIMLLGAAKEILSHKQPSQFQFNNIDEMASLKTAVPALLSRIVASLQRLLVLCDFPAFLYKKFQMFFQSLTIPPYCFTFANSLNILAWNDTFLVSVLKGQNITGERKSKGKKEYLWESITTVEARVEKMEKQLEYRELVRYLRVVKTTDMNRLKQFREKIPFYMCKYGEFTSAAQTLLANSSFMCCPACQLTPLQFDCYLKILRTGQIPSGNELVVQDKWIGVKGLPLRKTLVVKTALRILYLNEELYKNPWCWEQVILIACSNSIVKGAGQLSKRTFPEPVGAFLKNVKTDSMLIVEDLKKKFSVFLPKSFSSVLGNEADIILATQATVNMLCDDIQLLSSVLDIILAFGKNVWALKLLINGIVEKNDAVNKFVELLVEDLRKQKKTFLKMCIESDVDYFCDLLHLFLTFKCEAIQSVSMQIVNIFMEEQKELGHLESQSLYKLLQYKDSTAASLNNHKFLELINKMTAVLGKT